MPVTRKDVQKALFSSDSDRPKRNTTARKTPDVVNLDRLNSAQFMAVIGEGPSSETIDATKKLTTQRKKEDKLRLSVLTSLNKNVLLSDSITVEHQDSTLNSTVPAEEIAAMSDEHESDNNIVKDLPISAAKDKNLANQSKEHPSTTVNEKEKENSIETVSTNLHENETSEVVTLEPSCTKETQTPKLHILCMCEKCQGVVADFIQIVQQGSSQQCSSKLLLQPPPTPTLNLSRTISGDEEYVPLYKGAKVKVSVTTKSQLKCIKSNLVKDYVAVIMNGLYTETQMANMTAHGRTKGSEGLSDDVRNAMEVYLNHKFEENIETSEITEAINNRCYACRRKLWQRDDMQVRKPLPKKGPASDEPKKKRQCMSKKNKKTKSPRKSKKSLQKFKKSKSSKRSHEPKKSEKSYSTKDSSHQGKKSSKNLDRPTTGRKRPKPMEELLRVRNDQMNQTFESFSDSVTSTPCTKRKQLSQPSSPPKRFKNKKPIRNKSLNKKSKHDQESSEEDEEVGKDRKENGNQDDEMEEEDDEEEEEDEDEEDEDGDSSEESSSSS